jgi:predicted ester cyclase
VSTEESKALIQCMWDEVLNQGRVDRVDEYYASEFIQFGTRVGSDQFKGIVAMLHTAFADMHSTIDHIVAEDDLVVCDVTARGTQRGPFPAPSWGLVPPSGKTYAIKHCHWFRVVDGKIVEHWAVRDDLGQLVQLGHLTPPGSPAP